MEVEEHVVSSLKQAIAEDPDDAVQWYRLGLHSFCTRQFKTSQKYLKAAVARHKDCRYAWLQEREKSEDLEVSLLYYRRNGHEVLHACSDFT